MDEARAVVTTRHRLTAVAGGAVATFALFAASLTIPLAGFVSGLLAPFPVAHIRIMYGRGAAVIVFLAGMTAITGLLGFQAGLIYLVQCGAIALILPELILRQRSAISCISWTTALTLSLAAVGIMIAAGMNAFDVHRAASNEINNSIAQVLQLYEKSGLIGDDLATLKSSMAMAAGLLIRIYPAIVTLILGCTAALNVVLLKRVSAIKAGVPVAIGILRDFKVSEPMIWCVIAGGFALLAPSPLVTTPALNLLLVMCTLYFFQGLAVVLTIISRTMFGGMLRSMFWLMLIFQPYLAVIVAAIGIFDLWADFRTPRAPKNL